MQGFHLKTEPKYPNIEISRMKGFPDDKTAIGKLDRLSPKPGHYESVEPDEIPGETLQDRENKPGVRTGQWKRCVSVERKNHYHEPDPSIIMPIKEHTQWYLRITAFPEVPVVICR